MKAEEFYARLHGTYYNEFEYFTETQLVERQNCFLEEYFKNVLQLYELFRMSDGAIDRARREFLDENKIYSQADLETLRRSSPKDENESRGRKRSPDNYHEIHTTHRPSPQMSHWW